MIRNVLGEIRRIPGVGRATLYSTERSLRVCSTRQAGGLRMTADITPSDHRPRTRRSPLAASAPSEHTAEQRTSTLCCQGPASILRKSSDRSSCAPIPTDRRCGCADVPHRDRGPAISSTTSAPASRPQASLGSVADRQCPFATPARRGRDEGSVALLFPAIAPMKFPTTSRPGVHARSRSAVDHGRGPWWARCSS